MKKSIAASLFKGFETKYGTPLADAWFDGGAMGEDQLLDGVRFKASVRDGRLSVSVDPGSQAYMTAVAGRRGARWLKRALEYAQEARPDSFEDEHGNVVRRISQ